METESLQQYNKDTTDKRRPILTKSPIQRQLEVKKVNNVSDEVMALQKELNEMKDMFADIKTQSDSELQSIKQDLVAANATITSLNNRLSELEPNA